MAITYHYYRTNPGDPGTYVAPAELVTCEKCGCLVDEAMTGDHTYWHEGG